MGNLIKNALERFASIVALATDPFKVSLGGNFNGLGSLEEDIQGIETPSVNRRITE